MLAKKHKPNKKKCQAYILSNKQFVVFFDIPYP